MQRRSVLKAILGLALVLGRSRAAAGQGVDPRKARPQVGDRLVASDGPRKGAIISVADVRLGDPPTMAYPMDPASKVVRDDSRLNEVLLVHLDPADLPAETRARGVNGIVAYSAICTHTGCDSWEWQAQTKTIKCPCHFSTFDLGNGARVLDGPAPRRLPALPLKGENDVILVAGGFSARPGFQSPSG
ncbi:MAG TPA: Rieske 2Fe-2S domain-containing protein [Candidatus Methylomirabilis sp.]|nr:Rieske 2Fe-2S domain-containing protein [Candidatus Methylomirabilis sp.]